MPPRTVERKIYFFRANVGADEGGLPSPFNPTRVLRHIDALPFAPTGRYLDDGETRLCCWVDQLETRQYFRLGQIRRSGLPLVEQEGNLSDLAIPEDSGLVEAIHVVVFGNNIIGADFNFYGPRVSRLRRYLRDKGNRNCPEVTFDQLVRQDVAADLERLREIHLFHLKIRASYAATISEADADLGAAFDAAERVSQAEELELVLRPRKYSRNPLAARLLHAARYLVHRPDLRDETSKFEVKGVRRDTGAVELVDLLRDQLVAREAIVRQSERGRALRSESAYRAIERAYGELEDELVLAASVVS